MQPQDNPGYILRISTDEWLDQIYQLKKYYTGVNRNWKRGTPILLAKKTEQGDSILGYGITQKVEMLWEMTPEEEDYCRENKWRCALTFQPLVKFDKPLPIKDTILANDKRKGSFLHGALIPEETVDSILEQAEEL
ncbi:MAG TPA: hypothetical protein VMW22_01020 [Candidatus Desulfaltia sp.]|nr:hypothetical protein [Candidatus Desulfaltia sp.]